MSRCLAGEGHDRDRNVGIYPLRFDSLKYFPIPERKKLEPIIIDAVSWQSAQQPEQTQQDKSIARGPIQGELFDTRGESH